ncbi:MAG: hypothetical protein ACRD2I_10295 [Vicinamibacterales bacterium]
MDPHRHNSAIGETVLWHIGGMECTSLVSAADHIEIYLTIQQVRIDRHVFTDAESAAHYAIEKMHAYGAR